MEPPATGQKSSHQRICKKGQTTLPRPRNRDGLANFKKVFRANGFTEEETKEIIHQTKEEDRKQEKQQNTEEKHMKAQHPLGDKRSNVVYKIPCDCSEYEYIGETG